MGLKCKLYLKVRHKERIKTRKYFKEWVVSEEEQGNLEKGEVKVIVRTSTNHKLHSLVERGVARQKRIIKQMYLQNGIPDTVEFTNHFRIAAAEDSGLPQSFLPSGTTPASMKAIEEIAERIKIMWKILANDAIQEHLLYKSRENLHPELNTTLNIGDVVLVKDYLLGPTGHTGRSFKESLFQVEGVSPGRREVQLWHFQKNSYFGEENVARRKENKALLKGNKIHITRPSDGCILITTSHQMKEKIPIDLLSPQQPTTNNIKFDELSPSQTNLQEDKEEEKPEAPTRLKISDGKVMESEEIKDIRRASLRQRNKKN
jgi:hypothetical protein